MPYLWIVQSEVSYTNNETGLIDVIIEDDMVWAFTIEGAAAIVKAHYTLQGAVAVHVTKVKQALQ